MVRRHSIEVGDSEIAKVLPGPQYVARRVVDVEEVLQVAEVVRGLHRCYVWVGQRDVVATGEREHQLRLQRSLDVDVQFGLFEQIRDVGARLNQRRNHEDRECGIHR